MVGAGPNGLAAAITAARQGRSVRLFEAEATVGGGCRSAELTLPGYLHDVCSAIHPLAVSSSFFRSLPLERHGLRWIHPPTPLAHPLDGGRAVVLERSVDETAKGLGRDGPAYLKLMRPLVADWPVLQRELLGPLHVPVHLPALARFGLSGLWSARGLAEGTFRDEPARALFAGLAAHSVLPLERLPTAAFGLILGILGHAVGWPMPRGGSQRIADSLVAHFESLGGEIVVGARVDSIDQLPSARAYLLDVSPRQLLRIASGRLPLDYRLQLERFQHAPGVFKVDWALDGPIPWEAPECARAGTVHLGGTLDEIARSEWLPYQGERSERPFVILAQQSRFDPTRAPAGRHVAWGYCHVPNGSTFDMTERIERQIERFAPGFRTRILARSVASPAALEAHNANYVGGDISGGAMTLRQVFFRPALRIDPYSTPARGVYLCSASTPPGGGVHGLCGYFAARSALRLR